MKPTFLYVLSGLNFLMCCFFLYAFTSQSEASGVMDFSDKIIKVRGVVVVDTLGIERVIVGSHLPDPNFSFGYRTLSRGKGGSVSGVMLYDHEGQERGGYVTDDGYGNAFLTLDSKMEQHVLLLAEPQGGATLRLWDKNQNQINLGVSEEDASIQLTRNKQPVKLYDNDEK